MISQVYLIEPPGSVRDALAYAMRAAQVPVQTLSSVAELPAEWRPPNRALILIDQAQLEELKSRLSVATPEADSVTLWALIDPGCFPGIITALHAGAHEVLDRDWPPRDVAALVKGECARPVDRGVEANTGEIEIQLTGGRGRMHVPAERLIGLIVQLCDDVARRQRLLLQEQAERKRVERALLESEAFYQSLVETLPLALFRKDLNGRVTFANQRLCEVLGRRSTEILGRTDFDLFPRDLAEKYRADDYTVLQTRENFEAIEEFQTPTGERRYNHVVKTPVYNNSGELVGIQGVFSDVTARVMMENELAQERYLLDTLMNNSPDNIYFKDVDGRYLRINPAKARRSGLRNPIDAIGRSDFDFFPAEHARAALADEQRVLSSGEPLLAKEERISYADGSQAWMSTTKLPLKDRQGRIIGTFGVSHDITPLKNAQDALRNAAAAAEAANRAKSDFLANMSHEIRTPLNAVLGMTELVLGTPLTPVQRDYLKLVHESGESLLTVINDILDFSKIEAGKLQLDEAVFEFREFLGDTLKTLGLRAHRKGLELACEIAPEVPDLLIGDANRVRQVVVNLIGNAIKFTESGEVLARVSILPQHNDHASSDTTADNAADASTTEKHADAASHQPQVTLHFEIADTGIGIPVDKFQSIFQAFEQADASTTRKFGGTGLGLAISSRLVDLMGGRIWVDSVVGRGSTFHFTAVFRQTNEAPVHYAPAPPELLQDLRVLVVDDNSTNRRILAEMLASWGMRPVLACSAAEALDELRSQSATGQPFSLVVTDVNMPELSGFDLVSAAQADGSLKCGIIVMLTSGDRSDDVQACNQLGVDNYLIKPVKQSELFNAILRALGARHADEWKAATTVLARTPSRSLHVLLAEDSSINQKLAVGLLDRWGHRIDVAENGKQAVAKIMAHSYDLVLMDVQMPELDGFDATIAIRDWEHQTGMPHVPVIAMTAHALPGDRERCLAAGMDDYLSKPIRSEALFQMLEKYAHIVPIGKSPTPVADSSSTANESGAEPQADRDESSIGLIDWRQARNNTANDEGLLRDVAAAFCEETPLVWEQLRTAIAQQDFKQGSRALHTLKNSLTTFGVEPAQTLARDLEMHCRETDALPTLEQCQPLGTAVAAAVRELQQYLE